MPINYKNYPKNWKSEIRPAILERAQNKCEFCGVKNYAVGVRNAKGDFYEIGLLEQRVNDGHYFTRNGLREFYGLDLSQQKNGKLKTIKIVLTIAHIDHDIQNNDYENLKALCQKCHLHHDKDQHKESCRKTRNNKKGLVELF